MTLLKVSFEQICGLAETCLANIYSGSWIRPMEKCTIRHRLQWTGMVSGQMLEREVDVKCKCSKLSNTVIAACFRLCSSCGAKRCFPILRVDCVSLTFQSEHPLFETHSLFSLKSLIPRLCPMTNFCTPYTEHWVHISNVSGKHIQEEQLHHRHARLHDM